MGQKNGQSAAGNGRGPALRSDPNNARVHGSENKAMIRASLEEVGAFRSIGVDGDGIVRAGNGVFEQAQNLGLKVRVIDAKPDELVAVRRKDLKGEKAIRASLLDNRTGELSEWDPELLGQLQQAGLLEGLSMEEFLAATPIESGEAPAPQVQRAHELQKKWHTAVGQTWIIASETVGGKFHRLACGDCRDQAAVKALMQEKRAGLMNTDPPYGISYANEERPNPGVAKPRVAKPRVANDELKNEELQKFLEESFRPAHHHALAEDAAWYMWHPMLLQGYFAAAAAAAAAGLIIHRQIIWVKPVLLLGRGHYHWKHELCFMGWVQGHEPPDYGRGNGERDQTTVWEIDSVSHADREELGLATPKPVELFSIPIIKHLKRGDICYEPFTGSGPQFVAAEKNGRLCYGMDLEPACVAVTLQRLADMGLKPRLAESGSSRKKRAAA